MVGYGAKPGAGAPECGVGCEGSATGYGGTTIGDAPIVVVVIVTCRGPNNNITINNIMLGY